MDKFNVGDRVWYLDFSGKKLKGTVSGKGTKDGKTVYDVDLDDGSCCWGYADQFRKA